MNGAQALFKALTDAGLDSISRDTLIRREFRAAWGWRSASNKAKTKVIKKEPVDLPPAI
jgi:hypothetical protein